ncbi:MULTISPECIES: alcohol dehydrogenase [Comamonas]|jgi:alcohol dehydrogenase, propanol-preferring|uniref:alcohol dehydrogenase n=1 Tax=Comamonas sediminis TaxID=1783360 RepID=A0ABV4AYF7_9BURK|nr:MULTISPECIES: alcohol dehydrogenase [unclassified Comamonas]ULR91029.1 alcohol dehydrogenase [Comamonas sp. B21-038]
MISYDVTGFGEPLVRSERPTPVPTGDQVLVRVEAAGVCHSDLHIWHGEYDLGNGKKLSMADRGMKLPLTLGHEIAGEVVAMGPDAKGVEIGKRYVVFPWHGCGECKVCKRGDENLCLAGKSMGVYQNGGYADHVLVNHAYYLVDIGDMPAERAAPYACSGLTTYSAIKKIDPQVFKDEKIVLFGAGGLGLMAILLMKAMGGAGVVVVEPDASKHAAALSAGADVVIDPKSPDFIAQVKQAAGGAVWAIIDCVGSSQTVQQGIDMLTKGGHLVQIGLFGGHVDLPTPTHAIRAITYQGTYVGNLGDLRELIALVRDKKLNPVPTTCMHFSKAFSALVALEQGKAVGRLMLTPNEEAVA